MLYCKKCLLPDTKPTTQVETKKKSAEAATTIKFIDGVCEACRWNEIKENDIDWAKRGSELELLTAKHRKETHEYDVVVPASGGKDSCYVSHLLKAEYGMNPLTVTWAPNLWTEIGRKNLDNLIASGFSNFLITPDGAVHKKLTKLALKKLGHPFQPFIVGQRVVGTKIAKQLGINLVFYGENVAEYGNPLEENYNPIMDPSLYTCFDLDNPTTKLSGYNIAELESSYNISKRDLTAYQSLKLSEVQSSNIEVHYMSYYRKWIPQENYYYAKRNTKFQANFSRVKGSYSKYAGIDDKMEWLHFHLMNMKFGVSRALLDASQEIRTGKITKEEGVFLSQKYDQEFPDEFLPSFLEYFEMSEPEFFSILDSFRAPHIWEKHGNTWKRRFKIS